VLGARAIANDLTPATSISIWSPSLRPSASTTDAGSLTPRLLPHFDTRIAGILWIYVLPEVYLKLVLCVDFVRDVTIDSSAPGASLVGAFGLHSRNIASMSATDNKSTSRGTRVWWPAPAKLNLFLHVISRRADGYHELQTAFQFIELCDELAFEPGRDGLIERVEGPPAIPAAADLVVRAAAMLRQMACEAGRATPSALRGARIYVKKRIPWGGGLGGGSSDAATSLKFLNIAWNIGFSDAILAKIGLGLGADVPVFLGGQSAFAEGVGEVLDPFEIEGDAWFVVIHPGVAVPTAEVFQAPELTRNSPQITMRGFLASGGRNDCEPVVRARYPQVAEALDWLQKFAPARLTGTGSCLFAIFDSAAAAERVAARVPDASGWQVWVVRGLTRSPLEERLRWGVAKW
jgi:4-diphosphocytidyl-2-C-methyl-D-erythritol kinase